MSMWGALLAIEPSSCPVVEARTASGAPIVKRRWLFAGSNGLAEPTSCSTRAMISAIGWFKLQGPLRWNDALRRSQEQRVVQNKAQPAKRVADSGRRQVQSRGRARDMAFFQDHAEEHKEI
ncbi:hypothetical protein ACVWXQ_003915 [Bradyrhizobium sp. S3.14.4]